MTIARWFIGLASGSGAEGADAVLVETSGVGLQLTAQVVTHVRRPHPRELRDLLLAATHSRSASFGELALLHRQLGESAAAAAQQLVLPARTEPQSALAAGHIGPLVWHEAAGPNRATLEVGQAAAIAERTGLTVFSDFRERDVAAGGQGMPITGIADWALYRNTHEPRLLVHLGGVVSLVHIPASARPQDVVAFEVGPGTHLLDAVIRQASAGREQCDAGGKHAVQGKCLDSLLAGWLEHAFFHQRPPRSLSRSEFGPEWIARAARAAAETKGTLEDLLCTLSHFVVRSIAVAVRGLLGSSPAAKIWLSGGGTRNGLLWRLLEQEIPGVALQRLDDLGVPTQARQAAGAAVLAALAVDGVPASSPGSTGSVGRILGRVTPGEPRNWARCLRWMSEQTIHEFTRPYRAA
jgi:anhydro-N-acetylmuramic acid kinase